MNAHTTTHLSGRHYETRRPVRLEVSAGKIVSVSELIDEPGLLRSLPWIAPGFIDLQSNGYGGQEFSSPELTAEKVAEIAARQPAFGVTRFCPTITTASFDTIAHAMRTVDAACRTNAEVDHAVAGIHLEGPYIASEEGPRGAHPLEHCRPPDWNEFAQFQDAAQGRIRIVTLSPEYPEAPRFIVARRGQRRGRGHRAHGGHVGSDSRRRRGGRNLEHPPGQRRASLVAPAP